jgi:pimeloyl-ACP methyl ester carboxylesterase
MTDRARERQVLVRTSDGAGLYAEERGSGDPLLLLAGQSSSHLMWGAVIDRLAERHRVLVFDYRGTGRSESPEDGYSTPGFAADAVAVLDAFGVPRAHVYGFSMGGRVAQWVAIDHPDRVGALVLGATTPGDRHGVPRPDWANALLARPDDKAGLDAMMFTPAWLEGRAERPGVCQDWRVGTPPLTQARHYEASQTHDAWDRLPSITAPTLVIHGSDDPTNVPQNAFMLAERIPGATVHIIDGARHGYWEEFSIEAEQVVLGFLERYALERRSPVIGAVDREQGDAGTG